MLISEALIIAKDSLKQKGVNSYQIDALLILCYCLSFSKEQIIFNPNFLLNPKQQSQFFLLLTRRQNREPISHIVGKREFFGEDFFINRNVLDPRPDSESLIEWILNIFPNKNTSLQILELGVGSGCLIATILRMFPNAFGVGIDISALALEIAQKNIDSLGLSQKTKLIKSNWFANLGMYKNFDLIISNPPYIKTTDIDDLQQEVKNFEPHSALDGGEDGLNCYHEISQKVRSFLNKSGFFVVEIGQNQKDDVVKIFTDNGLKFIQDKKDLSGIIRCLLFTN